MKETTKRIEWHPAFQASIQIEFEEECDKLIFGSEHLLSKKPMQIDELIIKVKDNETIQKNIGRIFRKYNIIEYKSPDDYLTVNDFYKVYGYCCFYQAAMMEGKGNMCEALRELMDDEFQEYGKQVTEQVTTQMIKNAYESIKDKNTISQILKVPVEIVEKVLGE